MPKFRNKPVIIEAEQFLPPDKIPEGVVGSWRNFNSMDVYEYHVFDSEQRGKIPCHSGDWIITGTEGERYPCSDVVFKKKYEPVNN